MDLGGDIVLAAEAAAHWRLHDAHAVHRKVKVWRNLAAVAERVLRRSDDVQHAEAIREGEPSLGLHRHVIHRVRAVRGFDDYVRLREPRFDLALAHLSVLEQVSTLVHRLGIVRERVLRGECRRERLVIHNDARDRLLGDLLGLCRNQCHRVGDAAHLLFGEHALVENRKPVTVGTGHILVGEDGVDAG